MLLWVAMAALAAVASLSVLLPLYRARSAGRPATAQEISVYRDQLGEVDRDLDRGLIGDSEAKAARTEIARRLIGADDRKDAEVAGSAGSRRVAAVVAVAAMPALALGLYLYLGSPDFPDMPLAARLMAPPDHQDLPALVARVEAHLAEKPDDGAGWEVIAPVYVRMQRYDDAVTAYGNAVRLLGSSAERESNLGEAIVRAQSGAVTPEARAAFTRALAEDANAVAPRFYLAVALAQDGKKDEATAALNALIKSAPPDAPWVGEVQKVLADLGSAPAMSAANPPPGPSTATEAPGPSASDVEAAGNLTPEQRTAMIQGMVAQLAARLETDGKDPEGWARLIRSYMVLGRSEDAKAALAKAETALAGDVNGLQTVDAAARAAGLGQ